METLENDKKIFDIKMMKKALEISEFSKAEKRKVGALIVNKSLDEKDFLFGIGFNRMYNNMRQECENSSNESYECVIHAEESAIINMFKTHSQETIKNGDLSIYVTYSPCMNCCKLIAHAGIKEVIYLHEHKINFTTPKISGGYSPQSFLQLMGIKVKRLDISSFQKPSIALIHHTDNDGYMSGWLLKKNWEKEIENKQAKLIEYNYGLYDDFLTDDNYKKFVFVDVTPPLDWLILNKEKIENKEIEVMIYDHHKSKIMKIKDLHIKNLYISIYEDKCGAFIYYTNCCFFVKSISINIEKIVCLINDYDLWHFTHPDYEEESKNEVLRFNTYMQQFTEFDKFCDIINGIIYGNVSIEDIFENGKILINKICNENNKIIKRGKFDKFANLFIYEGYPNYWLNNLIEETHNFCYNLGFQFDLEKNQISFSLRSENMSNCDKIAESFGGGGHNKAAGFKLSILEGTKLIQDCNILKYLNKN